MPLSSTSRVPIATVAREWMRIGVTGFGGPPAHIRLLRRLVVERRRWLDAREFEQAVAACSLLPGPASTQLAIFSAGRVAGPVGAVVGGLGFVVPAVATVLVLSTVSLAHGPPDWVRGAGSGAGAALAAVAVDAGPGGIGGLAWVAFKVAALSYGGGFVIAPLMQHDATHTYHWMTSNRFLNAVALGQVTPGPVVSTVAAVGYAARGIFALVLVRRGVVQTLLAAAAAGAIVAATGGPLP